MEVGLHGQNQGPGPRLQEPAGPGTTNLTRGCGRLHRAGHGREGVEVQVQQAGLLRERAWGLKLGSSR